MTELTHSQNAGSVVGRILPGYLADIIGPLNVRLIGLLHLSLLTLAQMVIMATALSVLWIAALWIPANSTGVLIACALLYGYSSGSWVRWLYCLLRGIDAGAGLRLSSRRASAW